MSLSLAAQRARGFNARARAGQVVAAQFPTNSLVTGEGLPGSISDPNPPKFIGLFYSTPMPPFGSKIVVFDFFSALHTWPIALAQLGFQINHLYSTELDQSARVLGAHHIQVARRLLPTPSAIPNPIHLPHNVLDITFETLLATGHLLAPILVTSASWPCLYRSQANPKAGGADSPQAALLPHVVELLLKVDAYRLDHGLPPAVHLFENVHVTSANSDVVQRDQANVVDMLGKPIVCDAARFDSFAHRVRGFYSNVEAASVAEHALAGYERTPGLLLQAILDRHRYALPVQHNDSAVRGRYPVNVVGKLASCVPTLVSRAGSHAFRGPAGRFNASVVIDRSIHLPPSAGGVGSDDSRLRELNADERERAMGFSPGATAHPHALEQHRRQVLGQCCDMNQLRAVLATLVALSERRLSIL